MKTSLSWPRNTATESADLSGRGGCGVGDYVTRFSPTLGFRAFLLCALMALAGCEDQESSKAQTVTSLDQAPRASDPTASDQTLLSHVADRGQQYVGSATCAQCHSQAYAQWQKSHHAMAMAEPTADSVKGKFGAAPLRLAGQEISFAESDGNFTIRLDGTGGEL